MRPWESLCLCPWCCSPSYNVMLSKYRSKMLQQEEVMFKLNNQHGPQLIRMHLSMRSKLLLALAELFRSNTKHSHVPLSNTFEHLYKHNDHCFFEVRGETASPASSSTLYQSAVATPPAAHLSKNYGALSCGSSSLLTHTHTYIVFSINFSYIGGSNS
jgi:hypothetical protein